MLSFRSFPRVSFPTLHLSPKLPASVLVVWKSGSSSLRFRSPPFLFLLPLFLLISLWLRFLLSLPIRSPPASYFSTFLQFLPFIPTHHFSPLPISLRSSVLLSHHFFKKQNKTTTTTIKKPTLLSASAFDFPVLSRIHPSLISRGHSGLTPNLSSSWCLPRIVHSSLCRLRSPQ